VGPYREKEGSYEAIREIWSPVYLPFAELDRLPPRFDGRLRVENRYDFTDLNEVRFSWKLVDFPQPHGDKTGHVVVDEQRITSPSVAPQTAGVLELELPANWQERDALYLEAVDPHGRSLYTWSWMIAEPGTIADRVMRASPDATTVQVSSRARPRVTARETQNRIVLEATDSSAEIDRGTGRLVRLTRGGAEAFLRNGPRLLDGDSTLKQLSHRADEDGYAIEATYDGELRSVRWSMSPTGWIRLDYAYSPKRGSDVPWLGVTFNAEESELKSIRWLGKGPYRVWGNRRKGVEINVWEKAANDAITGTRWSYPEFRGLHDDWYWARLETSGAPLMIVSATKDLVLRLFTPSQPQGAEFDPRTTRVDFPDGDISFLHGIAPIGTKFDAATSHGLQGQPNAVPRHGKTYEGTLFFRLGEP
jgi:hypothetical protein